MTKKIKMITRLIILGMMMLAGKGWSEAVEKPDFIPPLENGLNISSNYRYTGYDDEVGSEFPMVVDYDSASCLHKYI